MTPHPLPTHSPRSGTSAPTRRVRVGGRRLLVAAALVGAQFAAAGPLAAHALATPATAATVTAPAGGQAAEQATLARGVVVDSRAGARTPHEDGRLSAAERRAVRIADDLEVLTDTYEWHERGPRVEELQELLDVTVDGWYGPQTRRAHVAALVWLEADTDGVPLPPGPSAAAWAALRKCESGGNYGITSRTGKYRGAYQFDRSTWNSVAGRHDPSLVGVDPAQASPADQDAMAAALYSERGARPWPHCGRHLG